MTNTDNDSSLVAPDLQRAVLGSVLMDNSLLNGPLWGLGVSDFVGTHDQEVYKAIIAAAENGEPFDQVLLAQRLSENGGGLDRGGATAYIGDLIIGAVPDPGATKFHVEKLQKLSQLRRLGVLGERLVTKVHKVGADPGKLLQEFADVVQSLRDGRDLDGDLLPYAPTDMSRRPEILRLADVQARSVDWLWQPYLPTSMLAMLSGDPGAGKTIFRSQSPRT